MRNALSADIGRRGRNSGDRNDSLHRPSKPTNPDKENPGTGTNSPQTGDNSNFMLWITLMGASAVGLGGFLLQKAVGGAK